jgi:hypothetical protein
MQPPFSPIFVLAALSFMMAMDGRRRPSKRDGNVPN